MEGHEYECCVPYEGPKPYTDMGSPAHDPTIPETAKATENPKTTERKQRHSWIWASGLLITIILNLVLIGLVTPVLLRTEPACTHLKQVPVYTQERRIDTFLFASRRLPLLSEFTICMWLYTESDDDDWHQDWIISMAVEPGLYVQLIFIIFIYSVKALY